MIFHMKLVRSKVVVAIVALSLLSAGVLAEDVNAAKTKVDASTLNPNFFYFIAGQIVGMRGFTVGDAEAEDWSSPVEVTTSGISGRSKGGKVTASPENYQGNGDAINLVFSRKSIKGDFGLYGSPINLEAAKNAASLTFDIKVNKKPDKAVTIGLDCEYPCRAETEVGRQLRKLKQGEWAAFPIPLNCFQSDNFDLKKINGVFLIGSEGKLDVTIANIRIERLSEGDKGCATSNN